MAIQHQVAAPNSTRQAINDKASSGHSKSSPNVKLAYGGKKVRKNQKVKNVNFTGMVQGMNLSLKMQNNISPAPVARKMATLDLTTDCLLGSSSYKEAPM